MSDLELVARHHGRRDDSGHGEGAHRSFRRGASRCKQLGVDYIDESEVLTPADDKYHVDKHEFTTPFVCGARDLGEALRRIAEGAAMIRSKGEAGSGNIVEAVRHMRAITDAIANLTVAPKEELVARARDLRRAARTRAVSCAAKANCRSCCSARAAFRRRPTRR